MTDRIRRWKRYLPALAPAAALAALACGSPKPAPARHAPAASLAPGAASAPPLPGASNWTSELLPARLAGMRSAPMAAALLVLDDLVFTRLDSARLGDYYGCTEPTIERYLFAADGVPIAVSDEGREPVVTVAVTSVGEVRVTKDAGEECEPVAGRVTLGVRTDTLDLILSRGDGRLKPAWGWNASLRVPRDEMVGLAGPLYRIGGVDWNAVWTLVDSVRRARGLPLARPWPATSATHRDPTVVGSVDGYEGIRFPALDSAVCPSGRTGPPVQKDYAEIEYVDPSSMGRNMFDVHGAWSGVYETDKPQPVACIQSVQVIPQQVIDHAPCSNDPEVGAANWSPVLDDSRIRPALLVRDIPGLRSGPVQPRLTIVEGRQPIQPVLVYSDTGEELRVWEVPDGAGYYLRARRGGVTRYVYYDQHGQESWDLYWVGLLNADDVPDFVVRTTVRKPDLHSFHHTLHLYVSRMEADGPAWPPAKNAIVLRCGG